MSAIFEGRTSNSPYIEIIWRGHVERDYSPTCPADGHWNLLFTKQNGQVRVSIEGPTNRAIFKHQFEGNEFLVIKFKFGIFMPNLPIVSLINSEVTLPEAAHHSFWLNSATWQMPDFDNVETFVDRLVRDGLLVREPVVSAIINDQPPTLSSRTVRRFLHATGLTPKAIQQIERAKQAAALLEQGNSILDAVHRAGYADQPHLTRSLRRYYGQTPAQIALAGQTE